MLKKWIIISAICCTLATAGHAEIRKATQDNLLQRKLYLQAEKTLSQNNTKRFNQLLPQLTNYPLYCYLQYADLMKRMRKLPNEEVNHFIKTYSDLPLIKNLYSTWLNELIKQNKWHDLMKYYDENLANTKQTCEYLATQLDSDNDEIVDQKLPALWLVGESQPDACDPIFKYGFSNQKISEAMIWQRIQLSLDKGNYNFANHLTNYLPNNEKHKAEFLLSVYKNPKQLASFSISKDKEYNQLVLHYGLIQLAKTDPNLAMKLWERFQHKIVLSTEQHQKVENSIGNTLVKKGPEYNVTWLKKLRLSNLLPIIQQWQLEKSIASQDWAGIINEYQNLSPFMQEKSKWRYWYARSLFQLNYKEQAKHIFQELAKERHYYAFLASYYIDQPLSIQNNPLAVSKNEYQEILSNHNIQRAFELYALKRYNYADAEWKMGLKNMTAKQRYIAARAAYTMHRPDVALLTSRTLDYHDDLTLSFPVMYDGIINKLAKRYQIPSALILAMIRQESSFRPDAISISGALGLMQLMPPTAGYIAEKIGRPRPSKQNLYEANTNIQLGSAYLDYLFVKHAEHPLVAIASYNAGPNRVKRWLPNNALPADVWVETIPWQETRDYVKLVLTYTLIYQYLLGNQYQIDQFLKDIQKG